MFLPLFPKVSELPNQAVVLAMSHLVTHLHLNSSPEGKKIHVLSLKPKVCLLSNLMERLCISSCVGQASLTTFLFYNVTKKENNAPFLPLFSYLSSVSDLNSQWCPLPFTVFGSTTSYSLHPLMPFPYTSSFSPVLPLFINSSPAFFCLPYC